MLDLQASGMHHMDHIADSALDVHKGVSKMAHNEMLH